MQNEWESLLSHPNHKLRIAEVDIDVHDQVFTPDPRITFSSSMVLNNLPNVDGKSVLDLGCGTGIIALICALRGAHSVVAVDISHKAIANTKVNIAKHQVEHTVQATVSDRFSNITGQFDYIFANLPILDEAWHNNADVADIVQRFIAEYKEYLHDDGVAYLVWGSFADITPVLTLLQQHKVDFEQVTAEALGYTWTLIKMRK